MEKRYKINEIFYSLQGEGHHAGRAAVFVRFSGCNLRCPFCDTDFSEYKEMTATEIVEAMLHTCQGSDKETLPMVVLTGGEPTLQVDADIISRIHDAGFPFVAMESNGTKTPPSNLDWLTVSPKEKVGVRRCDELKVLFDGESPLPHPDIEVSFLYLQPLDTGDTTRNAKVTAACIDYIKQHPEWQLSLQTHKLLGIR